MERKPVIKVSIQKYYIMTADAFDESIQDAKKAGMNGYVTKPVDPDKLYRTLSELIPVS